MSNVYPANVVMPFGKHRGKQLGQIVADDAAYLDWVVDKCTSDTPRKAVKLMCQKYAPEIEQAQDQREFRRSER